MKYSNTKSQIEDALRKQVADPFAFDEFLDAWNGFFESAPVLDDTFEKDVINALETAHADGPHSLVGPQIRRMLNAFPNPALVVQNDGRIISQNFSAMKTLSIELGDGVDQLPFELQDGELFSALIGKSLGRRNHQSDLRFLRAFSTKDDHSMIVAVLTNRTAGNSDQTALVILIDPSLNREVADILTEAFELTQAECEVLLAFLSGANLSQIASMRRRSLATVRTQMNTIMTKAGVSSQADLMRNALALAQFHSDISKVSRVAKHPFRKSSAVLRPGGRSVEVTLAGDMLGKLVVVIPDITLSTFPAVVEAQYAAAGLCVVTLARPGFGSSDPAPCDSDYTRIMADDLKALLVQLGHNRCVLLGHSTSSSYAYRLGGLLPDHISRIVLLSPLPPAPYLRADETRSP
ncbi:alpha/beta fold hydrolase [uncultured Roseobacter sp.]|uniref:alpha/beta fold hydrolase n=1 Tax=uncultured Roseobacter sp. TaxID=114847 RepID=UPI00260A042E|nr:alpha/beta fold hydrolase [uncultured Roseobacter sp.]